MSTHREVLLRQALFEAHWKLWEAAGFVQARGDAPYADELRAAGREAQRALELDLDIRDAEERS